MGGLSARRMRGGRKKARFATSGGCVNFGVDRAIVVVAGIVEAQALRRNKAEPVTKLSPSICVAHCSGARVLCVWPNGVIASHLELAVARNECRDVEAFRKAMQADSEVNCNWSFHGDCRVAEGHIGACWRNGQGCRRGRWRRGSAR
jgi:hypothetical protein